MDDWPTDKCSLCGYDFEGVEVEECEHCGGCDMCCEGCNDEEDDD